MRSKLQTLLYATILATLSVAAGGCEDAAKHGVQAHVPALAPAKAAAAQVSAQVGELPLRKLSPAWLAAMAPRVPSPKDYRPSGGEVCFR